MSRAFSSAKRAPTRSECLRNFCVQCDTHSDSLDVMARDVKSWIQLPKQRSTRPEYRRIKSLSCFCSMRRCICNCSEDERAETGVSCVIRTVHDVCVEAGVETMNETASRRRSAYIITRSSFFLTAWTGFSFPLSLWQLHRYGVALSIREFVRDWRVCAPHKLVLPCNRGRICQLLLGL